MNEITWGIPIIVDLFFAGLGAGSFCLGAITSRRKGEGWSICSKAAAFLAPFALFMSLSMLILDLGYKLRFWMTLSVFNVHSPMSVGAWLLTAFILVSVVFALYWVPASIRARIPWIGSFSIWNHQGYRDILGVIGIVLAFGVSVYTGLLLSVTIVPLWRSLSLPFLFFLSALATGFSGGGILTIILGGKKNIEIMDEPFQFFRQSYRVILPFYFAVALIFSMSPAILPESGHPAMDLIRGWSGLIWWIGVIGIGMIVPFGLIMNERPLQVRHAWVLFGSLLIGGLLLRLVLVFAGQGALQ